MKKSAHHLEDDDIFVAEIDCSFAPEPCQRFKIKSFPTFKLFIKGQPIQYIGSGLTFADFHNWAYKKVHGEVKTVTTREQLDEEIAIHELAVLWFGPQKG